MPTAENPAAIRSAVQTRYAAAADAASRASNALPVLDDDCCAPLAARDPITRDLYPSAEVADVPSAAILASLGCGNPTALAELKPGEVVLDLGSGGGIDVLLSARRVGSTGFAYGLDMTDEMLALAQRNAAEQGVRNVLFVKGEIEQIPLPTASVDVVISNCVINLSADKPRVLREAFRVLRPGGRFAVSDVVVQGQLPPELRRDMELWAGCIAGALEDETYRQMLTEVGFQAVHVEVTRVYNTEALATSSCCATGPSEQAAGFAAFDAAGGRLVSAFVRATRPMDASALSASSSSATDVASSSACCSTAEQVTCCQPSAKSTCCGDSTGSCGCR